MEDEKNKGVHWSFWLLSIVMLIWNIMGCINFFVQMNPDMLTAYRESERAIIEGRPAWATGAFVIAVFGGALGCLFLLLRKSFAYYLFVLSLLGVIVTMIHTLGIGIDFGLGEIIGIIMMPLMISVFLLWYTKYSQGRGWIN